MRKRPGEHFAIEYRRAGVDIDPQYSQVALALGEAVVRTLGNKVLISRSGRYLPLMPAAQGSRRLLTVVCGYPGDAEPPAPTLWRVPAPSALWRSKDELAQDCFVAVHRSLAGTDLVTKRQIRSGPTPAPMRIFRQAFLNPRIPELTGKAIPVTTLAVADRIIDAANEVFNIISGSEAIPQLRCDVEAPPAGIA